MRRYWERTRRSLEEKADEVERTVDLSAAENRLREMAGQVPSPPPMAATPATTFTEPRG